MSADRGHGVGRGTSNRNERGGSDARRRRREWLVETFRADTDIAPLPGWPIPDPGPEYGVPKGFYGAPAGVLALGVPCCRCYRCGVLLTVETVTVDRIIPGCQGGSYRRSNIRPSCQPCASLTGAALGNERKNR